MDLETWKRHRTLSFLNFCLAIFTYGLLNSIYSATEFFYFRDSMNLANPALYYGIDSAFFCISAFICSFAGSVYFDMTHEIRSVFLFVDAANVVGHILHSVYFHPAIVIAGHFLVGMGAAREVSAMAELARLYEAGELTGKLSIIGAIFVLGRMIGPCMVFLFNLVDVHIGKWRLHVNNMADVVMGTLYIANFVLNALTLKNLSKQRVMKEEVSMGDVVGKTSGEGDEINSDSSDLRKQYVAGIRVLFTDRLALSLFAFNFFAIGVYTWLQMLIPIATSHYLTWTQVSIAIFYIATKLSGGLLTSALISPLSKFINDINFVLYSLVALFVALLFFLLFPYAPDKTTKIAFIYVSGVFLFSAMAAMQISAKTMLAKMVPVSMQGVTEGCRNAIQVTAAMIFGLALTFASHHPIMAFVPLAVLCVILFICFLVKRGYYYEPRVVAST